jgi:hypothetical protein
MVWNRPDQDQLDDTAEFPAITEADEPDHVRVRAERSLDGWVEITITELDEGELLSGTPDAEGAQADAAARREAS